MFQALDVQEEVKEQEISRWQNRLNKLPRMQHRETEQKTESEIKICQMRTSTYISFSQRKNRENGDEANIEEIMDEKYPEFKKHISSQTDKPHYDARSYKEEKKKQSPTIKTQLCLTKTSKIEKVFKVFLEYRKIECRRKKKSNNLKKKNLNVSVHILANVNCYLLIFRAYSPRKMGGYWLMK